MYIILMHAAAEIRPWIVNSECTAAAAAGRQAGGQARYEMAK